MEVINEGFTPLLVGVRGNFGVRVGGESVPKGYQLVSDFDEVVNLTIQDRVDVAAFGRCRLLAVGYIDDRKSAHTQLDTVIDEEPVFVWTSVDEGSRHLPNRFPIAGGCSDPTGYSAHSATLATTVTTWGSAGSVRRL